jgi:hypothetical protein
MSGVADFIAFSAGSAMRGVVLGPPIDVHLIRLKPDGESLKARGSPFSAVLCAIGWFDGLSA